MILEFAHKDFQPFQIEWINKVSTSIESKIVNYQSK